MAAANVEEPGALAFLVASTMRIKTEDKQALLEEADIEHGCREARPTSGSGLEVLELVFKIQSDARSEIDKTQREYFLREQLKAIQPSSARPTNGARLNELRARSTSSSERRGLRKVNRPSSTGSPRSSRQRRIPRYPHLPRLDRDAALEQLERRQPRSGARPQILDRDHSTSRKSRTASSSTSPCASSSQRLHGPDPLLRRARPASARPPSALDRRARWAASLSASASAACATRPRSAATAAPISARCPGDHPAACATPARQPGLHDRRNRQDRRRLPRRPRRAPCSRSSTPSRTTLSATTTSTCRSTSRRSCSSPRPTSSTRIPGRCATAWRSSSSPATPNDEKLHIASDYLVPKQLEGQRPEARRQFIFDDAAVPARSSTTTRVEAGVRNLERQIGADLPQAGAASWPRRQRQRSPSAPSACATSSAPARSAETKRAPATPASPPAWPGPRVGGEILFIEATPMPGNGILTLTGQIGDVMKESATGGAEPTSEPTPPTSASTPSSSPSTTSTSTSPPARSPKTAPAPASPCSPRSPRCFTAAGEPRRGHDRRNHAPRSGPPHRRPQRKDPRRQARRHHHRHHAGPQ